MIQRKPLNIGGRLRVARKKAGLTLDMLAKTSGVSKAMLSQIEQNKANPTVVVLYNVATALNMDMGDLLGETGPKARFHVIRSDDERYHFVSNEECTVRTLSPLRMEKDIEFYEIVLHGHGTLASEPHFQDTEEFITIAKGRVKVSSGNREATLKKGDSIHCSADVPHSLTNMNKTDAVVYMVVKYRCEP